MKNKNIFKFLLPLVAIIVFSFTMNTKDTTFVIESKYGSANQLQVQFNVVKSSNTYNITRTTVGLNPLIDGCFYYMDGIQYNVGNFQIPVNGNYWIVPADPSLPPQKMGGGSTALECSCEPSAGQTNPSGSCKVSTGQLNGVNYATCVSVDCNACCKGKVRGIFSGGVLLNALAISVDGVTYSY